ncbi:hypothetical protein [Nocardioides marmoriginsengisoli]|nr:hypothetical protein [Nocardioides marmoriginsengisoli]
MERSRHSDLLIGAALMLAGMLLGRRWGRQAAYDAGVRAFVQYTGY